jgi:hypothetical protein
VVHGTVRACLFSTAVAQVQQHLGSRQRNGFAVARRQHDGFEARLKILGCQQRFRTPAADADASKTHVAAFNAATFDASAQFG